MMESVLSSVRADTVLSTVSVFRLQAQRLRKVVQKHHMRATSAELGDATWFGDGGSSLIDYVWPQLHSPFDALAHYEEWQRNWS